MKKRLRQEDEHNIEFKNNHSDYSKKKEKSNKLHIARQKFKEEKKAKEEKRKVEALIIKFCVTYCLSNLIMFLCSAL